MPASIDKNLMSISLRKQRNHFVVVKKTFTPKSMWNRAVEKQLDLVKYNLEGKTSRYFYITSSPRHYSCTVQKSYGIRPLSQLDKIIVMTWFFIVVIQEMKEKLNTE
ncbi:hypothetical protein V8G54_033730 [Vigna mungo]|uniref:Uncharacterized protein n=1 Tax=Vigna mungo TaxID=3915 RepID=A0AAQ3MP00_VIGMU